MQCNGATCWLLGFGMATLVVFLGLMLFKPATDKSGGGVAPTAGDILLRYVFLPTLSIGALGIVFSLGLSYGSRKAAKSAYLS